MRSVIEPFGENASHGRNERRAAGEEYLVDMSGQCACLFQNIVKRAFDPRQIALDPAFEVGPADSLVAAAPSGAKSNAASSADESAILVADTA